MASEEIGLSSRVRGIEPSGIRRIFELMATMKDPINLSIGQAHYDPPKELIDAACDAMRDGFNRYTMTQGLPDLNDVVLDDVEKRLGKRLFKLSSKKPWRQRASILSRPKRS